MHQIQAWLDQEQSNLLARGSVVCFKTAVFEQQAPSKYFLYFLSIFTGIQRSCLDKRVKSDSEKNKQMSFWQHLKRHELFG